MRQIKFRAWFKQKKEMGFVQDLSLHNEGYTPSALNMCNDNGCGVIAVGEQAILMQFTGLIDKNGKEIYEGDIVKWEFDGVESVGKNKGKKYHVRRIFEVHFLKGSFMLREWRDGKSYYGGLISGEGKEVIGNIYENPELLKT